MEVYFEFVMNYQSRLDLIEVRNLKIWDSGEKRSTWFQLNNYEYKLPVPKFFMEHKKKCEGIYCNYHEGTNPEDSGDKLKDDHTNNPYLIASDSRIIYKVHFKSILVD